MRLLEQTLHCPPEITKDPKTVPMTTQGESRDAFFGLRGEVVLVMHGRTTISASNLPALAYHL